MAVERLAIEDPLEGMDLVHQSQGFGEGQWRPRREQLRLDPVEARLAVGPGIDGGIQRGEFDCEDFRALIAGARIDPGLPRARGVARLHGCQHFVGIRHQAVDIRRAELLVGGRRLVELGLERGIHALARLAFAGRVRFGEQDAGLSGALGHRHDWREEETPGRHREHQGRRSGAKHEFRQTAALHLTLPQHWQSKTALMPKLQLQVNCNIAACAVASQVGRDLRETPPSQWITVSGAFRHAGPDQGHHAANLLLDGPARPMHRHHQQQGGERQAADPEPTRGRLAVQLVEEDEGAEADGKPHQHLAEIMGVEHEPGERDGGNEESEGEIDRPAPRSRERAPQ